MIIRKKAKKSERLPKSIVNIFALAKVVKSLSFVDFAGRYIWVMSNANWDTVKKLG